MASCTTGTYVPWTTTSSSCTTGTYSSLTSSSATGTTGTYPQTGTANNYYYQQFYQSAGTSYTAPAVSLCPSPADVRHYHELARRREWLEKWRNMRDKRENERRKKEQQGASERARLLLFEYLDEQNRQNLIDKKPIEVVSELHNGVKYQIPDYGRIKAFRDGKVISELCLQVNAQEWLPDEDKILTKLLFLRNDEAGALKLANHFNVSENLRVAG